jgi:hypothetical protein
MKTRILLVVMLAAFAVSISYTFYLTVVRGNFEVVNFEPEPEEGEVLPESDGAVEISEDLYEEDSVEPVPN